MQSPIKPPPPVAHTETLAERNEKIKKWMMREVPPVAMKRVTLYDGRVTGEIESVDDLKYECTKENGTETCSFDAHLGKAQDDEIESSVMCSMMISVGAFGPVIAAFLKKAQLQDPPVLDVKKLNEGIAVKFTSNTTENTDDNVLIGTAKIAVFYAHGYEGMCIDMRAGARKTFDRVVEHFFSSLQLQSLVTLFAEGYQVREGDRTSGIRYTSIARVPDSKQFTEQAVNFWLATDGKSWSTQDRVKVIQRNNDGGIEKAQTFFWAEGQGPSTVTAKPSEVKAFRLKFEIGDKASSLESTPKAPLDTELWSAPLFRKLSSGSVKVVRYAFLDVFDGDPAFQYLTVTRTAPGVLKEVQESPLGSTKAPISTDELQVDEHGLVTKEVSSDSVSERVYVWGKLPDILEGTDKPKGR